MTEDVVMPCTCTSERSMGGDCEMAAYPQETETDREIPRGGEEGGNHSSEEELEEINMCKVGQLHNLLIIILN